MVDLKRVRSWEGRGQGAGMVHLGDEGDAYQTKRTKRSEDRGQDVDVQVGVPRMVVVPVAHYVSSSLGLPQPGVPAGQLLRPDVQLPADDDAVHGNVLSG